MAIGYWQEGVSVKSKHSPLLIIVPIVLFVLLILFSGCRKESTNGWSKSDTTAVFEEIGKWRDTFEFGSVFNAPRTFSTFAELNSQDSISYTGDSLVKIYHLTQTRDTVSLLYHRDSLAFLVETDTVCDVTYEDYATHTISILQCDTIWLVKYQKDTLDSIWHLTTAEKKPFTAGEFGKVYAWSAPRKLRLKRQAGEYQLKQFGGLTVSVTESAPGVLYVGLDTPGKSDIWHKTRIDSLIDYDSLFSVGVGESIMVSVKSEDPDTLVNPYYFFIRAAGDKINLTKGARFGQGKVAFESTGIKHIAIEVLPGQSLFYPNSSYSSAIWSIPVRVR